MLTPGTAFPNFSLPNQDGQTKTLADYAGSWLVVYFYPKDDTPGCTIQGKSFTATKADFDNAAIKIVGISADEASSHKDFCAKEGLNFKLLADADGKTSTQYGSTMEYEGTKMAARNTFLINPKGEIARVYTGVKPAEHSEQILKDLAELKKS